MRIRDGCFESKYLSFWFGGGFELSYAICGYFDNRPEIRISMFWCHLILKLPFRNRWTDECDPPKWGIAYHGQTLWVYRGGKGNLHGGGKWWTIYAPWSWQWFRTSYLRKDGSWEHEFKGDKRVLHRDSWDELWWSETHPYTYTLRSGVVQHRNATIKVSEREWRWHWFKWLSYPSKTRTTVDVTFDGEVGEGTGSWKGGTLGCSYELKRGDTPLQTLRRMERERKFT